MQNSERIQWRRERDLGEILTDTFKFLRQNYRALWKVFHKASGPFLLLLIIGYASFFYFYLNQAQRIINVDVGGISTSTGLGLTLAAVLSVLLFGVTALLFYASYSAGMNYAVKSYMENNGVIQIDEVVQNVRNTRMRFAGLTFLSGLLVTVGTILCFLPGIYLFVPLSLVFSIAAFKNMNTSDSISHSFALIKQNWWMSFFTLLIMGIIYSVGAYIFQFPAVIYMLVKGILFSETIVVNEASAALNIYDVPYLILTVIGVIGRFFVYVLMIIVSVFIFFNLDEKHFQTGTFETIDNLGSDQ